MTEKMKNVVLTASSCAHGRRVACLSKLSRKVIEDVSEFLPSISPYGTHPSPCFLDIRLVVTDASCPVGTMVLTPSSCTCG